MSALEQQIADLLAEWRKTCSLMGIKWSDQDAAAFIAAALDGWTSQAAPSGDPQGAGDHSTCGCDLSGMTPHPDAQSPEVLVDDRGRFLRVMHLTDRHEDRQSGDPAGTCQCEHESHEAGTAHRYLGVPANPRRVAMHVGPVCDDCADGHLADYMRHCDRCGAPDHWTEDHGSADPS